MTPQVTVPPPGGLLQAVRATVDTADEALLCVAFANEAGVNLLAPALERAGRRMRLLSTTAFGGTTAAALDRAAALGADVRVLNLPRGTYHPKLYLVWHGDDARALVGSANLTSGLLRNAEVAVVLSGRADAAALAQLREVAEGWWTHPAALPWTPEIPAAAGDVFAPDLWGQLEASLASGMTVPTVVERKPNRIVQLILSGVWIETTRSRDRGRGAELVPAWMLNIAWDYLAANGQLTNRYLLAGDGLNVKRSSAVCALLAQLPSVEVTGLRPIELTLTGETVTRAAEAPLQPYVP
jgi:HKD family nuclease